MTPLLLIAGALAQAPADPDPVAAAAADARRLTPALALRTRYLSLHATPAADREQLVQVVSYWTNSLSREAVIVRPRRVGGSLLAVTLDDYGWDAKVWERLADVEPYFLVRVKVERHYPAGVYDGKYWSAGNYKVKENAFGPWVDAPAAKELAQRTGSAVPIVRADWWCYQVAANAGRQAGYYAWLGLKSRKDFEALVALDVKASQRVRKEQAAIVARSGVAHFPRQVLRFQSVTGGYWMTRDVLDDQADARNAVRNLNGDLKHQAEEHYGTLPNGLPVFYLSDADGTQQDTAPDKLGSDRTATGNDARIHVGVSCVRCHTEVLRPIDDWARTVYRGDPVKLSSPDYAKLVRLRQLYLSDLERSVTRDRADFAEAIKAATGLTPEANAAAVARVWRLYADTDRGVEDLARECGTTPERLRAALLGRLKSPLALDPILAGLVAGEDDVRDGVRRRRSVPLRVEDVEQLMSVLMELSR